ncbi:DUF58 domain-containing protein [Heyndrickxia acidicola]|uniref:DUF58 domain-containing protein n=1 Tax=Heyndrickxia acidicola TaxID=209389 RepID=A0ABU6MDD3_9BACI|nr:DUF58 domain-containing protein [Heyndrickxia acidicola]MED1202676.1 DUF58 domain-containing protein [Heyndrickxia acidicola]
MFRKMKAGARIFFVVLMLFSVLLFALFQGGYVSWFLFYSFSPIALYALLLQFSAKKHFRVETKLESLQYSAGDQLTMNVSIQRSNPFPLFYISLHHDSSPELGMRKVIVFPRFKRRIELELVIPNLQRGEYKMGEIKLKTGDPLGLLEKEVHVSCPYTILVFPPYTDVIYRTIESRYEQGSTASQYKVQNDTTMVTGVRPYQPGDRFTWIDWKATARLNDLQTKEFEVYQSHDVLMIIDRTPSSAFELCVTFAASLIRSILRHGGQTGLYSVGQDHSIFPIRGGEQQQYQLFHHLAKVKADSPFPFASILKGNSLFYHPSAALMMITSKLEEEMIQSLYHLAKRKGAAVVFVIKNRGESITSEEQELHQRAYNEKIYIKFLYEDGFRTALAGVKKNE